MQSESIGYLEVEGLPGAIVAADRMLKTANVSLRYVENTKGGGWITVSVVGDVAAVNAAIDAGKGELGDHVYCSTVIARPAPGIDTLGKNDAIKGAQSNNDGPDDPQGPNDPQGPQGPDDDDPTEPDGPLASSTDAAPTGSVDDNKGANAAPLSVNGDDKGTTEQAAPKQDAKATAQPVAKKKKATCNLCGDPDCPRKLGEPRKKCIHYAELEGKKK